MSLYDIYRDPAGKAHVIKSGFSWSGFCFAWLCCCWRGMIWIAALQASFWLLFVWLTVSFWGNFEWLYSVNVFADLTDLGPYTFEVLSLLSFSLLVTLHLYIGIFCNQWTRTKWQDWGWERQSNVLASDWKAAKQQADHDPGRRG